MVNKQSQSAQETNPLVGEKIGRDLLLRGWDLAVSVVNQARERNLKSGVKDPERFTAAFFDHMEPMEIRKRKNWLAACINIRTNTPYTLDSLISANVIAEEEKELFGDLPLPRRELVSLHRIQAQNKVEYLSRVERWFGLNKSAGVITIPVEPDYTRRITVDRMYVDRDPERPGTGTQVIVKVVGDSNQWIQAEKNVSQAFRNAIPTTDKTLRGVSFTLIREGAPHVISPQPEDYNIDSFVNKPFDEIYDKAFKPATSHTTNINVDPETFRAFLKYQKEHEQDNQYQ